jgi:hypothetical protein
MKRWLLLLPLVLHLGACQSVEPEGWRPALLTKVDSAIDAELHEAVREMLGGSKVVLGPRELMRVPHLLLERAPVKDPNGILHYGSERETPQSFRLEIYAGKCRLVQVQTGQSRVLQQAQCKLAP